MSLKQLKTLQEIEVDVTNLAKRIKATSNQLPTYNVTRDGGYMHIEVDEN